MAAQISDIDVIINVGNREIPCCPHGPMLMFVKYSGKDSRKRFFACSAFRDRKDCNFHQWVDEAVSNEKKLIRNDIIKQTLPLHSHASFYKRYKKIKTLAPLERCLCYTCDILLLPEEVSHHQSHKILSNINDDLLSNPTLLFNPKDNNKTFAQYFFTEETVEFVISQINLLGFTHVLCVGSPRIFHALQEKKHAALKSLLLDLDSRFGQIWPPGKFCRFNMFNSHVFEESDRQVLEEFVEEGSRKKIVLVMDPPFGGMVEPLAATVKKISKLWQQNYSTKNEESQIMPILWFFPYFLEKHILENLPQVKMLDYRVDYDNHSLYKSGKKKKGSPVRIFTNIKASQTKLPEPDYWYCKVCERYSAVTNVHCQVCEACTSKDGTKYRHCFDCNRCVKSTKSHCITCNMCQLMPHICLTHIHSTGCHVCGSPDHKRKFCPQNNFSKEKVTKRDKKRKLNIEFDGRKKKKK